MFSRVILCLVFMATSQPVDLEVFLGPETRCVPQTMFSPHIFPDSGTRQLPSCTPGQPADFHDEETEGCRPKGVPIDWSCQIFWNVLDGSSMPAARGGFCSCSFPLGMIQYVVIRFLSLMYNVCG